MTTIQERLAKKPTIDIKALEITEEPPIQGDDIDEELTKDIVPAPSEEINPFGDSSDEANAVDAIQRTIDPDPERLPLIANSNSPRANAIGDTVTDYIELIASNKNASIKDLATFGKSIIRNCLKHQIGSAGKDNRTKLYLEALKAQMAFEQEADLRDKAFQKR